MDSKEPLLPSPEKRLVDPRDMRIDDDLFKPAALDPFFDSVDWPQFVKKWKLEHRIRDGLKIIADSTDLKVSDDTLWYDAANAGVTLDELRLYHVQKTIAETGMLVCFTIVMFVTSISAEATLMWSIWTGQTRLDDTPVLFKFIGLFIYASSSGIATRGQIREYKRLKPIRERILARLGEPPV